MIRTWLLIFTLVATSAPCFGSHLNFTTHVVANQISIPRGVSLGDLDGDGHLDLMTADSGVTNQVAWYESDGATSPGFSTHVIGTNRLDSSFVMSADMNGDTFLDVISSSVTDGKISYYANNGLSSPSFTEQVIFDPNIPGADDGVRMISVGDLDGDGDLDVASASVRDDRIAWFENQGPTWVEHTLTNVLDGARAVWIADLDGDTDMDVIGGPWFGDTMVWFENDGNLLPTFTERPMVTFPTNPTPLPNLEADHGAIGGQEDGMMWRMMTEDMDNDGDIDVIAARRGATGSLEWYESDGGSPPQYTRHVLLTDFNGGKSVFPEDLDADGDMDIVFASRADDRVSWFANDGDPNNPTFEEHILHVDPDWGRPNGPLQGFADGARSVFAGDIDGDGDSDVAWVALGEGILAWEENLLIQLHADFDRDGDVDNDDLTQWENSYGVDAMADTDGDGDSDGEDFLTWQRQFTGSLGPLAASTAVPEPATGIMLMLGLVAMLFRRD